MRVELILNDHLQKKMLVVSIRWDFFIAHYQKKTLTCCFEPSFSCLRSNWNHSNKPRVHPSSLKFLAPFHLQVGRRFFSSQKPRIQGLWLASDTALEPENFWRELSMCIPVETTRYWRTHQPPPKKWCQHISVVNFLMNLNYCHRRFFFSAWLNPNPPKSASVVFFLVQPKHLAIAFCLLPRKTEKPRDLFPKNPRCFFFGSDHGSDLKIRMN